MTAPATQQTPGGQREDTALAVGILVAGVLEAVTVTLAAFLGVAVAKVIRGRNRRAAARALHAAAAAALGQALQRADTAIDRAQQRITRETLDTLNAISGRTYGFSPGPLGSSWDGLKATLRKAAVNALADIDDTFSRAARLLDGTPSGALAAQRVLDDLAERGPTAYVDRAGRRWSVTAYATMATRTAASRLALAVQLGAMADAGLDLVMVDKTTLAESCPRCVPFEWQLLSVSGRTPVGMAAMVVDHTGMRQFGHVKASVADAVARGLLHPSCRHMLIPWADGMRMTVPLPSQRRLGPSYVAQQRQRALERVVRREHARRAVALTAVAKAQANRRLVAARSNLHRHVQSYHSSRKGA
jgi:hypothetical protein